MMHFANHLHVPDGATHFHRGIQALGVCARHLDILWHYSVGLNRDMSIGLQEPNGSGLEKALSGAVFLLCHMAKQGNCHHFSSELSSCELLSGVNV